MRFLQIRVLQMRMSAPPTQRPVRVEFSIHARSPPDCIPEVHPRHDRAFALDEGDGLEDSLVAMSASDTIQFAVRDSGKNEQAVVLVHGFHGDPHLTFGMLPAFLAGTPECYGWDIHCFGY